MFDFIVKDAEIVDGSGGKPFRGSVAVAGDRVAEIWRAGDTSADSAINRSGRVIDAAGRMLTPGFVDVHSHSDFNILVNPEGESKLRQGITTEIVGNCGFSAFPLVGAALEEERRGNEKLGLTIDWSTPDQYFARLERTKPSFNIATFVGHGNVRGSVVGFEDRAATPDEMKQMHRHVDEAMDAGALGLSTGLIYAPGIFADEREIIELQKTATRKRGIYASHVRGEGDTLIEAADEFMAVVDGAQSQGQFSHLKASAPRNWGKVARVLEKIEQHNARGGNVRFDKYPYIASSTELASLLPRWARDGGRERSLERLKDPAQRGKVIKEAAERNEGRDGWASVLICEAGAREFEKFQGQTISEIAKQIGCDPGEAFIELLVRSELSTSICNFTMSQDETDAVILHPLGMVCSDAACRAPYGPLSHDTPHPRAYGTFGKFFRDYVKERELLPVEKAVAKVTSLPCETFELKDRGRIAKGCFADLLLLDWPKYEDKAKFADPHHYCGGVDSIWVNGVLTVEAGNQTGNRGGRPLRRNAP